MATETFKYPDATTPTVTLTFSTSGHSINDASGIRFNQIIDRSIGGVQQAKNLGDSFQTFEFTFVVPRSSETETDWADVLSFFGSTYVNGGVNTFVWTDYDSVERTVMAVSAELQGTPMGESYVKGSFLLEVVNT
jgi:hypothetical protein